MGRSSPRSSQSDEGQPPSHCQIHQAQKHQTRKVFLRKRRKGKAAQSRTRFPNTTNSTGLHPAQIRAQERLPVNQRLRPSIFPTLGVSIA